MSVAIAAAIALTSAPASAQTVPGTSGNETRAGAGAAPPAGPAVSASAPRQRHAAAGGCCDRRRAFTAGRRGRAHAASAGSSVAVCDRWRAHLLGRAMRRARLHPPVEGAQRHGCSAGAKLRIPVRPFERTRAGILTRAGRRFGLCRLLGSGCGLGAQVRAAQLFSAREDNRPRPQPQRAHTPTRAGTSVLRDRTLGGAILVIERGPK